MILNRLCPICGSNDATKIDQIDMINEETNVLPSHYDVVCCNGCGFSFASMDANQHLFDKYYSEMNIYSEAESLRKIIVNMDSPYLNYIYDVINSVIDDESEIIDIGCGGGQVLDFIFAKGHKLLTGLDPSVESINNIKARGYKGKVKSLFDIVDEEDIHKYNLVISTMVAEHIYDLQKYVNQLKQYVAVGGYIFITVPAIEGFCEYICDKPNYFNQEHINYFSKESMQNLFGTNGAFLVNEKCINELEEEKCLYMLFQQKDISREIVKDENSINYIKNYLKRYQVKEDILQKKINDVIASGKDVVFWGSGQYAKSIINKYPDLINRILYFVDSNTIKQGNSICGKKIVSPEILFSDEKELMVCVCSMKNGHEIRKYLLDKGYKKDIILL